MNILLIAEVMTVYTHSVGVEKTGQANTSLQASVT